jgi:hypothetical protein
MARTVSLPPWNQWEKSPASLGVPDVRIEVRSAIISEV